MEYLEYLKALSSGDYLQQISSIPRIVCLIKEQPSPILVNTIAITMSVEFTHASNRVRYFIADFFSQCNAEMCMIRSKQEVLDHLMSVLDLNDPVAQCLMLKILGALAPLLTEMVEVHHKVLLVIEGPHRQVREAAYSILPQLVLYCPTIAKHVFDKAIPQYFILKIFKVLPDDEETIKRAYSYVVNNLAESFAIEVLFILACRCRSIVNHVKYLLIKHQEIGKLFKLCQKYGKDSILTASEKILIKDFKAQPQSMQTSSISELLSQSKLSEKHYKYIYMNWDSQCLFSWITKRLDLQEESFFCYKLLYLLRVPSSFLAFVKNYSLGLALCYIRSGWRGSCYEIVYSLNSWEQYQCACEMMKQGIHTEAHQVFLKIKNQFRGSNEKVYEWICALIEITGFERSKTSGVKAFSHLGCLGLDSATYFQSEFFLCRYLIVNALIEGAAGKIDIANLFVLRNRVDKLLFLFTKPYKDLAFVVKMWRDLLGLLALTLTCLSENTDFVKKIQEFYPVAQGLFEDYHKLYTPQAFCRHLLDIPMNYPKQFFVFMKPIGIDLSVQSDMHMKIAKNSEFSLEFSAKTKEIARKPPKIRFTLQCTGNMKDEFSFQKEKYANTAGLCNLTTPITITTSGTFSIKVKVTILNSEGREIGKSEFAEITIESI